LPGNTKQKQGIENLYRYQAEAMAARRRLRGGIMKNSNEGFYMDLDRELRRVLETARRVNPVDPVTI
jgi:hypothetical protein